jgi:hypothetical protein
MTRSTQKLDKKLTRWTNYNRATTDIGVIVVACQKYAYACDASRDQQQPRPARKGRSWGRAGP